MKLVVAIALVVCAATSCARNPAFRTTDAVRIVAPGELDRVRLPLTVRWQADGSKYFAVFVDRAPVRPGTSLKSLIDDECRRQRGCPDSAWFAQRYVFITSAKALNLLTVPAGATGTRTGADHEHRVSVVAVDADGVRRGEAVASVEFSVVAS